MLHNCLLQALARPRCTRLNILCIFAQLTTARLEAAAAATVVAAAANFCFISCYRTLLLFSPFPLGILRHSRDGENCWCPRLSGNGGLLTLRKILRHWQFYVLLEALTILRPSALLKILRLLGQLKILRLLAMVDFCIQYVVFRGHERKLKLCYCSPNPLF